MAEMQKQRWISRIWRALLAPLIAAVSAILISSIALLISGNSPVEAFGEMWRTIDSTESVVLIINRSVPLYISGVAVISRPTTNFCWLPPESVSIGTSMPGVRTS